MIPPQWATELASMYSADQVKLPLLASAIFRAAAEHYQRGREEEQKAVIRYLSQKSTRFDDDATRFENGEEDNPVKRTLLALCWELSHGDHLKASSLEGT